MAKSNYGVAKSLNHTFRFIDAISPINDKENFEKYNSQIYPSDLELNKENTVLDQHQYLRGRLISLGKSSM